MYFRAAELLFCLFVTGVASGQKDICEGYVDSADAPHQGPLRFNVIHIAFSFADSYVLIADPEGRRFGVDSSGKPVKREIVRGFYEDDDIAEMDTNLPPKRQPREMTIYFARSGKYLIVVTGRSISSQWLKVQTNTCGKPWKQEITIPAAPIGTITRMTLVYDSQARQDPRVLIGESSNAGTQPNTRP